jgi:lysophospholipase L1-like esterase
MFRRWQTACLAVLGALALACEGAGRADTARPAPDRDPRPGLPASMAALGDSITAGYGTCVTLVACRRNSWSTGGGTRVDSHYRRILAESSAISGRGENFSVPGARAEALPGQARRAVRAGAEYVTILIGANDACAGRVDHMTGVAAFRGHVDDALRTLKRGLPGARVLVVSIPDVHRLWEVGHDDPRAVRAWGRGVCQSLLANPTSTAGADDRRRRQVRDRVDDYNRELVAACREYGDHCRHDGGRAHRVRFTLGLVNKLDYFHPNAEGQQKLAEVTFPRRFTW